MSKVLMISADSHAGVPPNEYAAWLDPKYRDRVPETLAFNHEIEAIVFGHAPPGVAAEVVDPRGVLSKGKREGLWDPAVNLAQLEAEGFVAQIIFPGAPATLGPYFTNLSDPYPADYRAAGCWAHNRWLASFCAHAPGRFLGVAQTEPWPDLNAVVEQIAWAKQAGLGAIGLPRFPGLEDNQPPLTDPAWDVIWRACVEHGLPIAVHIGHSKKQGTEIGAIRSANQTETGIPARYHSSEIFFDPGRRPLWQLIFSGAFDRFPELKVSFSELRLEWVEPTLSHLERLFDQTRFADLNVKTPQLRPSDYWRRSCAVAGQLRPYEVGLRHHIGVETVMFGSDYPHAEGSWPNTREWLRVALRGVPETDARAMLGGNAARFYGFDEAMLAPHVTRVGPAFSNLMSGEVDRALIDIFNWRSGFLGQAYRYDADKAAPVIEEDRRLAHAAG